MLQLLSTIASVISATIALLSFKNGSNKTSQTIERVEENIIVGLSIGSKDIAEEIFSEIVEYDKKSKWLYIPAILFTIIFGSFFSYFFENEIIILAIWFISLMFSSGLVFLIYDSLWQNEIKNKIIQNHNKDMLYILRLLLKSHDWFIEREVSTIVPEELK